ncbi:hypothetical protein [Shewanella sedimentimangrovi]|uniref:Uncharacterized protein n=1 Tax=Shewanella sedimentimangrovi TaxID=2814293 RepID=A0ABX7R6M8_9GAMM|nr:hypothetical protein [Shewanella sedimentimangrovi]QSX38728.1 hypothetical protein JYB85_07965 [Shewanella sedimentimangrovi]
MSAAIAHCRMLCKQLWLSSSNVRPWLIYGLLLLFWYLLTLFQHHSFEMGWGLVALVISLPFVPFVMVYLLLELRRHWLLLRRATGRSRHRYLLYGLIELILIVLFLMQFV